MKKAINLQAQLHLSPAEDPHQTAAALQSAFAEANPGMQLTVKSMGTPDAAGNATARVYIEGEQEPADPFAPLANIALHKAISALLGTRGLTASPLAVHSVQEVEDDDEDDEGLVLPPGHTPAPAAAGSQESSPAPASVTAEARNRDLDAPAQPATKPETGAPAETAVDDSQPVPPPAPPASAGATASDVNPPAAEAPVEAPPSRADDMGSSVTSPDAPSASVDDVASSANPPNTAEEADTGQALAASENQEPPPKGDPGNPRGSSARHQKMHKGGGRHSHSG